MYNASLQEVAAYVALTGHFILNTALVTSEDWFAALPADYRTILKEESLAAGDYATRLTVEQEAQLEADMTKAGMTFVHVDTAPFKEASVSVYKAMGWEDLRKQIDAALGK